MDVEKVMINIEPEDSLFYELGNNNYSFIELVGELVDNAIGGMTDDQLVGKDILDVTITINVYDSKKPEFVIRDNGRGISFSELPKAISPSGTSGGIGINEHGFGMKQAIASLGQLDYLLTKASGSPTYKVNKFAFGDLPIEKIDTYELSEHFTEIKIKNTNPVIESTSKGITQKVVPWLGAKYRRYLKENNSKINLTLILFDMDDNELIQKWDVSEFHPNYFHPSKRNNKPVIERRHFKGKGWEALLTFGYAPTKEEYNDLGIIPPKRYEPYYVSLSKQGLDIIKDDRIVNFTQLAEIGLIYKPHNNFNNIRGEIDLIKGFPTSTSKNFVMRHEHWVEMIIKIKDFLDSKDYLKQKVVPGEIPEFIYRERLAEYLKDNPFKTYDDVKTEVNIANG